MGSVFRQSYSKPIPSSAEPFTQKGEAWVKWEDGKGRTKKAKLNSKGNGIIMQSRVYTAKYRDGSGLLRKVSTGCRDRDAARAILADLERRAEKVKSGIISAAEDAVTDHRDTRVSDHVSAYVEHLRNKRGKGGKPRVSPRHIANVEGRLEKVTEGCGFTWLRDLNRKTVDRWLMEELDKTSPLSAQTLNNYMATLSAFGNWCVESGRLQSNPFTRLPRLDAKADPRRERRALTEVEIHSLLWAARLRPLAEHGRETVLLAEEKRKGRKTWTKSALTPATLEAAVLTARHRLAERPDFVASLESVGRERVLIYKTLMLTGLRKGELASITVGQLELERGRGQTAYLRLHAADSKSGQVADIPLRGDLASDIREWIAEQLSCLQDEARALGEPLPVRLPREAKLFNVPSGLIRIFDRDIAAAGIAKRDEQERVIDVHALRHTFGTHLSKGGVAPRTAQAAMRHSDLGLTMNVYTDASLLDVAGALDALPEMPLGEHDSRERWKATGTDPRQHVPEHVPTSGNQGQSMSSDGKTNNTDLAAGACVTAAVGNSCQRMSSSDGKRVTGVEPATFSLEGGGRWFASVVLSGACEIDVGCLHKRLLRGLRAKPFLTSSMVSFLGAGSQIAIT